MFSINSRGEIGAAFDELDMALSRCVELDFHGLTASQLWAISESFDFQLGWLAALRYELTSPFARPGSRRSNRPERKKDCDAAA
jgi:hypothetical protein